MYNTLCNSVIFREYHTFGVALSNPLVLHAIRVTNLASGGIEFR